MRTKLIINLMEASLLGSSKTFDYIKVKSSEALALIKTIHTFVYE